MILNVGWIFSKRQELNSAHILSLPGLGIILASTGNMNRNKVQSLH